MLKKRDLIILGEYKWTQISHLVVSHLEFGEEWKKTRASNVYCDTAWKVSVFGVISVRIFPHSDWIRRDTLYLSTFSLKVAKCGPE